MADTGGNNLLGNRNRINNKGMSCTREEACIGKRRAGNGGRGGRDKSLSASNSEASVSTRKSLKLMKP